MIFLARKIVLREGNVKQLVGIPKERNELRSIIPKNL